MLTIGIQVRGHTRIKFQEFPVSRQSQQSTECRLLVTVRECPEIIDCRTA